MKIAQAESDCLKHFTKDFHWKLPKLKVTLSQTSTKRTAYADCLNITYQFSTFKAMPETVGIVYTLHTSMPYYALETCHKKISN